MADWKQITARIRRARTSKDPAGQLANLYEKTHDAMAAFELARYFESTGHSSDAGKWYATAAERFRRADWKTKAQEAAVRLGVTLPRDSSVATDAPPRCADDFVLTPPPMIAPEEAPLFEQTALAPDVAAITEEVAVTSAELGAAQALPARKSRRRGRRGGRNRRKPTATGAVPAAGAVVAEETGHPASSREPRPPLSHRGTLHLSTEEPVEPRHTRLSHSRPMPPLPVEAIGESAGPGPRGRYGDPGLSSRLTQLEMHFRRLLTCAPARLDEADVAPVGPGVFVLTDSDLTTYYYVEACQTLRIAVANLMRGGASRRGADSIKPQLAEHLGIPESRVAKYLADHCVVRWLQLDEGASHFAHFVIAVLRPILNE